MFPPTLLRRRPAMQPDASPAADDKVENAAVDGGSDGSRGRRAIKFQYATGDTPLDGYTIKRGVGRGGFGEVYFATSDAGKEVALKLIRRNLDVELRGVRQCLNLKHPNLVALYDLRTDSVDDQWVVMEYVAGESLEDAVNRCPDGMPIEEAISWLRGIAAGVGYLHQSGIVHRDLKPANVYLERGAGSIESRVKIGDYGLSKFIATSRRSGQTESVGTVHYMAPEIAGGRYGREIDTYALGVMFYEMLTGRVPFEGESVGEVLMKHLTAEPDLTRVGEPYRTIVARALAKDPELRLSSVEEMLALLPGNESNAPANVAPPQAKGGFNVLSDDVIYGPIRHWAPVSTPPHTHYPTPQREPLWQALVDESHRLRHWWQGLPIPPLGKALILFGIVTMLVFSGAAIAIPAFVLPFYLVYYVVWSAFLKGTETAPAPEVETHTAHYDRPRKPSAPRRTRYNWRRAAMRERSARPLREKAATLTGSMLVSALVAIVASALAAPLLASGTGVDPTVTAVWLAAVATLGSWGVLAVSAFGEAQRDAHPPRRLMNLALGLVVGLAAAGAAEVLGNRLPAWSDATLAPHKCLIQEIVLDSFGFKPFNAITISDNTATLPMAVAAIYFGAVFLLVRWWRSAEYVRQYRWSVWSIGAVVIAAWALSAVAWFPQPLGMVLVGVIALATQVASPWCPPSRRAALARGGMSMEV
ncbi:serine/threonine-protein kinase [Botrimarina mediterranea]|nr:serine/threonine-protein kinase [Botrimarina mediterranea]